MSPGWEQVEEPGALEALELWVWGGELSPPPELGYFSEHRVFSSLWGGGQRQLVDLVSVSEYPW